MASVWPWQYIVSTSSLGWRLVQTSYSPDRSHRVLLIQQPHFVDINFQLQLEEIDAISVRHTETIFGSPDEGGVEGRIIWTKDGSRFVLVGPKFFVNEGAGLTNGEKLYLMHDLRSGDTWCNASQQRRYKPFSLDDLTPFEWDGSL